MTKTLAALLAVTVLCAAPARAQMTDNVIRIGVMNDQSGPYADNCGPGSVTSVRLAIADAGGTINGTKIEVVVADDLLDRALEAIATADRTGRIGDGKIFVSDIIDVMRIRTGETGTDAV